MKPIKCSIRYYIIKQFGDAGSHCAEVVLALPIQTPSGGLHPALYFKPDARVLGRHLDSHWGWIEKENGSDEYRVARERFRGHTWDEVKAQVEEVLRQTSETLADSYEMYKHARDTRPRDQKLIARHPNFEWEEED